MKTHFFNALVLLTSFTVFLFSCKKQEKPSDELKISSIQVDLSKSNLGGEIVLLKYSPDSKATDIKEALAKAIQITLDDANEILNNRKEISDIIMDIQFKNGKAVVTKTVYLNRKAKKIIEAYDLNTATNTYQKNALPWYEEILHGAACPSGFTQVSSCSNMGNTQSCVTNAVSTYFTNNINSIGDCAVVQVQVGTLSTRVCGKKC